MKCTEADLIDFLTDAEGNVRTTRAAYDRAVEQLNSVKRRIERIRDDTTLRNPPYKREPDQTILVITGKDHTYRNIDAIKAVRECTWLGLKEAKDLMESELPIRIKVESDNTTVALDEVCRRAYKALDMAGCQLTWE
jgi:ribosomal protein L7/L12